MCGRRGASRLGAVAPTHPGQFHTDSFSLVHCGQCDVVYLDPAPTVADLALLYEQSIQFSDEHYTDPVQVAKILDYYTTAIQSQGLSPGRGGQVLEIGAGLSWVARVCKQIEPAVRTVAQDVSAECAGTCPWVDRYFVGALDALPELGPFHLVSLTHVIEHLMDPAAMLRTIAGLLAPGGKAFITAPFRPKGWTAKQGLAPWLDYSYLHVPAHITYFSREWFATQARACGLRIEHWDSSHDEGRAFELVLRRD
jgi:SAM-dependent methyltransferase